MARIQEGNLEEKGGKFMGCKLSPTVQRSRTRGGKQTSPTRGEYRKAIKGWVQVRVRQELSNLGRGNAKGKKQ